ncbi:MAG: extracellular solute-binding protein [Candidatus Bathyarchaeia archaeon]
MSGASSKKNLRLVAGVIIIALIIGVGVFAYQYYSSNSMGAGSVSSSTLSSPTTTAPPLILYSADSMVAESTTLENAFTNSTGIMMAPPKAGGSLVLAQQIADGNPVSVFLSVAKPAVEPLYLGNQSSGWAIEFASDQMAIAYSNESLQNSAAATSILAEYNSAVMANTTQAWYNFFANVTSGNVKVGIANPNADPAGYRAWIVLEAAGQAYANNSSFFANRIITNNGNTTAASAADLISPLQTGQIQFLFIYRSAAIAHKLNYMQLPAQINLGNPKYSQFYSQFTYTISKGVQKGSVIGLWITVPVDSTDTAGSLQFVVFVVKNSPTLLAPYGLIPMTPARLYNSTTVPQPIQELVSQGYLQYIEPL